MRIKYILFLVSCVPVLIIQCSISSMPVAGGSDNPDFIVVGLVKDSSGKPASNAIVTILPQSFNPLIDSAPRNFMIDTTDVNGAYQVGVLQKGVYNVQAVDPFNGKRSLVTGVTVVNDSSLVGSSTLSNPGSIKVVFTSNIVDKDISGYIYIPGTTLSAVIQNGVDTVLIDSVPEGVLPHLAYMKTTDSDPVIIRYDIPVISEKITTINNFSWSYNRKIFLNTTANGANVQNDVINFPILIKLTDSNFDFSQAQSNGADVRFAKQNGLYLNYEIERWDEVNKRAEIWVKVDTVYGNDNSQYITMYWGNPFANDSSDGAAVFDTLEKFIGVWHMNEDPSQGSSSMKDRTANRHHATSFGKMVSTNSINGIIGKALSFDGVDDYLNAGVVSVPGQYSIGLWVKLDTIQLSQRFVFKDSSYTLWYEFDKDTASVRMEHISTTTWWQGLLQNGGERTPMTKGEWTYLFGTFDGKSVRLYKNGVEVARTNEISVIPRTSSAPLLFGKSWNIDFVNGSMDEIRIEGTARSADWIRLCYMNQRFDDKLVQFR